MAKHFERYAEVAEILIRHGFGSIAPLLGLGQVHLGPPLLRVGTRATPEQLVVTLEELGPTFIKLGQLLSTRPDVLPPAAHCRTGTTSGRCSSPGAGTGPNHHRTGIGGFPDVAFATFMDAPLASASIGQAHAATLDDGTPVVVKVRSPGVVAPVQEDLEILQNLAHQASRNWAAQADYNVEAIVSTFAATLRAERDYLVEGRNAKRFAQNFAHVTGVHIPKIYWSTTTSRTLTMESICGQRIDDAQVTGLPVADRDRLTTTAAKAAAQKIFEDGFFHADPHPGNLFVEATGRIGLIDFGMVGELDEELQKRLGKLLLAFSRNNPERISHALLGLSVNWCASDCGGLRQDMADFMQQYRGRRLGEIRLAPLIVEMVTILRTHHIQLLSGIALLTKMVTMTEGNGVGLHPGFNLGEVLKPYARPAGS